MQNLFNTPGEGGLQAQTNDNFELLKAWAGTTIAFAILQSQGNVLALAFLTDLLISGVVCGLAFVLHELAHRIVARHYGAEAHFIANNGMLLVSIAIAFAGLFFAAPGAVWHQGYLTKQQGGLIALAGPVTNLVLSLAFLIGLVALTVLPINVPGTWLIELCYVGFRLNAWIGLFNMIPAGPFDGAKVLSWSPLVFGITVAAGVALTFLLTDTALFSLLRSLP